MLITNGRIAIPLSTMANAQKLNDGWLVTDALGGEHRVDRISWDLAVEYTPGTTFPAQPGTYLIGLFEPEPGSDPVWRQNVLGWAICYDGETRPITLDPEALLEKPWQILHPDGRVERSDGRSWSSLDEWQSSTPP